MKWATLARIDNRTREGGILQRVRYYLTNYVGGKPTIVQGLLIERAAWLSLRIALLERKMAERDLTEYDDLHYMAWSNSLTKTLERLGIKTPNPSPNDDPEPEKEPTADLAAYLEARRAAAGPGAAL